MPIILPQAENIPSFYELRTDLIYLSRASHRVKDANRNYVLSGRDPLRQQSPIALSEASDKTTAPMYTTTALDLLPDFTSWEDPTGNYSVFMAPFNSRALHTGDIFFQQARLDRWKFPNAVTFLWSWPNNYICPYGVWGYNHLTYGTYLGGEPTPVVPKKLSQITALVQKHDIAILDSDLMSHFDVLVDIFLTNVSGAGSMPASALTSEIGVFLHTPPSFYSFAQSQPSKGTLQFAGKVWNVNVSPDNPQGTPYIMIQPVDQSDVLSATIDLKQVFSGLVSLGVLNGEEWFNGIGFGVEPLQGGGSMTVNSYSVTYN